MLFVLATAHLTIHKIKDIDMLYSMTGYGKASGEYQGKNYTIDVRTLNGKTTDIRLKMPNYLRPKEIELRSYVIDRAQRGKIDFNINVLSPDGDMDFGLNLPLIDQYYNQLKAIGEKHQHPKQEYLQTIIRIPNVIVARDEDISAEEWKFILSLTDEALDELDKFRSQEGKSLSDDLSARTNSIIRLQAEIVPHEEQRKNDLKDRLHKLIEDNLKEESVDKNRLEQEIVYYLEKLDIHEEKVRLDQHCKYFLKVLNSDEDQLGKKLNFISQEMGREINTLGSKAQYSSIQQKVVQMKVELDQIKEQLANVL